MLSAATVTFSSGLTVTSCEPGWSKYAEPDVMLRLIGRGEVVGATPRRRKVVADGPVEMNEKVVGEKVKRVEPLTRRFSPITGGGRMLGVRVTVRSLAAPTYTKLGAGHATVPTGRTVVMVVRLPSVVRNCVLTDRTLHASK
jgi:hypothetical protein